MLNNISGISISFVKYVKQLKCPPQINCSLHEKNLVDEEIEKYQKLNIIQQTVHSSGEYISQIFPRMKKSGGVRIILNLKPLNKFIRYEYFKMENMVNVLGLIQKDCYMASIDLKDAYFTVNFDPKFRKYLRFVWNEQLYEFVGMPNGLTSAPREFTKILKPVFAKLRTEGFRRCII